MLGAGPLREGERWAAFKSAGAAESCKPAAWEKKQTGGITTFKPSKKEEWLH